LDEYYEGHAVANGVYVAAANRIGLEQYLIQQELNFGASFIAGPQGEILAQTRQRRDFEVDLDLQEKMYVRTGRSLETEELMLEHY
jgi:N-carbamoylputrescine amidase